MNNINQPLTANFTTSRTPGVKNFMKKNKYLIVLSLSVLVAIIVFISTKQTAIEEPPKKEKQLKNSDDIQDKN